ncbi:MAG: MFS transporter, partial [Betaproteobacteria bacterium]|nr:MFS transporter [Betaproteobacteria bacterium]
MSTQTSSTQIESAYAWTRLWVCLALMTIGGSGMYTVSIVLPKIQAEFHVSRGEASLPYTLAMIGFGLGGVLMGRLSDRFGVALPAVIGAIFLCLGYITAGSATTIWQFSLAQGLLIGLLGTSATFAPLIADTSKWFTRRRGIALAICMSGNYLAGAVWSPVLQHYVATYGWRQTYTGMGIFCVVVMLPLITVLRRPAPALFADAAAPQATRAAVTPAPSHFSRPLGMSPGALQSLLGIAGVACCVAMS